MGLKVSEIEEDLRRLLRPEANAPEACSLALYQYAAAECTAKEAAAFKEHLLTCRHCRVDLSTFQAVAREAPRPVLPSRRVVWLAAACFALLVVGIGFQLLRPVTAPRETMSALQIKGFYQLRVAVQRGPKRFAAASGSKLLDGDVLGFFYTAPAPTYLMLLFADEQLHIRRLFPTNVPTRLPAGVERPLPDGGILESGHGCEWIVAFFSERALVEKELTAVLRQALSRRTGHCTLKISAPAGVAHDVFAMKRE